MRLPNILALLVSCLLLSAHLAADLYKGVAAYRAGAYETAFREGKSSAEQAEDLAIKQEGVKSPYAPDDQKKQPN